MRLVVDASVALKWFFRSMPGEADVAQALQLLRAVKSDRIQLLQPPHFIAEIAAVLSREAPDTAPANVRDLLAIDMEIVAEESIYARAVALAVRHRQHVFDTLYHAIALSRDGVSLVTADERYAAKAGSAGGIVRLGQLAIPA